jgi:4-hydroxy-3-polyprenylbenzoate decarboxylase
MKPKVITLAMTGASGAEYTLRLMQYLLREDIRIQFITSQPGQIVMGMETELKLTGSARKMQLLLAEHFAADDDLIRVYSRDQWTAPPASGSSVADAMVVCPCSMGSLASIAVGSSDNLIHRAADVVIKERRTLVLVPRETPFSAIHLENMLKLARLGVVILPPNPGFYHGVSQVTELIDFVVARILDQLGIDNDLAPRWGD